MLCHIISAEDELKPLGTSSKLNAERAFLEHLFMVGYETAGQWLDTNLTHLGRRSSVDLRALFDEP